MLMKKQKNAKRLKRKEVTIKVNIPKCIIIIILMLCFLSTIFAVGNLLNVAIIKNVTIGWIEVGGLTMEEANTKIEDIIKNRIKENLKIQYNDEYETTISLKQLNVEVKIEDAVKEAYQVGRKKSIISSNYEIIKTLFLGNRVEISILINEEQIASTVEDIANKIPGVVQQSSYYIEDNKIMIVKGKEGVSINQEEVKTQIRAQIKKQILEGKNETIFLKTERENPKPIVIEEIQKEIYRKPKNAYYDEKEKKLYPEVVGIDFANSIEEIKKELEQEKEEYQFELTITVPEITTKSFAQKAFPEELAQYSTRYDASNKNRTNNIILASEKIDGIVIMPGEIFSYNKTVGERTIKTGYKEAAVYRNGKIVEGIGGGICQVSSTLYNAVLLANLEIVNRSNHYFITSYVPVSRDATVSYGSIDFKFKNNRSYPIKITCNAKNGISQVKISGMREEKEYEVVIQEEITEVIPYQTKYQENSELISEEEKVIQKGVNGYKSEAYRILKQNGKIISKILLSKDSYNPLEEIIQRKTK